MGLDMRLQPNASLGTSSSMFLCTGNSECKVTDKMWTLLTGDKDSRQPTKFSPHCIKDLSALGSAGSIEQELTLLKKTYTRLLLTKSLSGCRNGGKWAHLCLRK